jgi:transcriptional regulator
MFRGPQAYSTPSGYPGKHEHGEVVPTWNYVVAHVHGVARVVDGRAGMLQMLRQLTDDQESARPTPWSIDDAPAPYIDKLMRAIVGIEIPIDRLEGKLKASQDEALADRWGTVRGLTALGCPEGRAMADWVRWAIDQGDIDPA